MLGALSGAGTDWGPLSDRRLCLQKDVAELARLRASCATHALVTSSGLMLSGVQYTPTRTRFPLANCAQVPTPEPEQKTGVRRGERAVLQELAP